MRRWTAEEVRKRLYTLIDADQPAGIEDPLGLWARASRSTRQEAKSWVEAYIPTLLHALNETKSGKALKSVNEKLAHRLKNVMFRRE